MAPQKALIGASQAIFREDADDFKQGRTNLVVKILGRQFLLTWAEHARADVTGKIRQRILSYDCSGHDGTSFQGLRVEPAALTTLRTSASDAAEGRVNVWI